MDSPPAGLDRGSLIRLKDVLGVKAVERHDGPGTLVTSEETIEWGMCVLLQIPAPSNRGIVNCLGRYLMWRPPARESTSALILGPLWTVLLRRLNGVLARPSSSTRTNVHCARRVCVCVEFVRTSLSTPR